MSKQIFKETDEKGLGVIEEVLHDTYLPERVKDGEIALTYSGKIAVKRKDGSYVVYNEELGKIENQMNLVLDASTISKFIYLMPTQSVNTGDIVKIKETFYYVISETENKLKAINLSTGTNSNLTTEINIMTGSTTYKKVVNLIQGAFTGNTEPGFNPMMLLLAENNDENIDLTTLMLMQSMNGTSTGFNPMIFLLAGKNEKSDLSTLMLMQAMSGNNNIFGNNTTNN